jgi:hypothetical protein
LRELLGGELSRTPTPLLVAEQVDDRDLQLIVRHIRGRHRSERVVAGSEPRPPPRHSLRVDAQLARHLYGGPSLRCAEHDVYPLGEPPLQGAASA